MPWARAVASAARSKSAKAIISTLGVVSAATPSGAALDVLWTALGGAGADELELESVVARLGSWAQNDDLGEAILFKDFLKALST